MKQIDLKDRLSKNIVRTREIVDEVLRAIEVHKAVLDGKTGTTYQGRQIPKQTGIDALKIIQEGFKNGSKTSLNLKYSREYWSKNYDSIEKIVYMGEIAD